MAPKPGTALDGDALAGFGGREMTAAAALRSETSSATSAGERGSSRQWYTSLMAGRAVLERLYQGATKFMPPVTAARLDRQRPSFASSWGGPLNGQAGRREVVRNLAGAVHFDRVLETGTFRGASTEFFSHVFGLPIETVEVNPRYYAYSCWRLKSYCDVTLHLGDSRVFLRAMANAAGADSQIPFIYLDAHWEKDLPLRAELEVIRQGWANAVVMVDDFEVPGDPGYGFDDYGPGRELRASYLPPLPGWQLYYPARRSEEESGARRGSCVLGSADLASTLDALDCLRPAAID